MADGDSLPFRRVVVALDTSASSRAAMAIALRIAAGLQREFTALFIEDDDLFSVSELPFTRETRLGSKGPSLFDPGQLERDFRQQAEALKKELESATRRLSVRWSFDVVKTRVGSAMADVVTESDLLTITGAFGSVLYRPAVSGFAIDSVSQGKGPLLIVGPEAQPRPGPIAVAFDGSPYAVRALDVAARLAAAEHERLIVMLYSDDDPAHLEAIARQRIRAASRVDFRRVRKGKPENLIALLCRRDRGMIVLHANVAPLVGTDIGGLLRAASCPVLLLRDSRPTGQTVGDHSGG